MKTKEDWYTYWLDGDFGTTLEFIEAIQLDAKNNTIDLLPPATQLEVVYKFMGDDYPPSNIKEYVITPSGDIVVILEDDGRGKESLWFNKDWDHPKSFLRKKV